MYIYGMLSFFPNKLVDIGDTTEQLLLLTLSISQLTVPILPMRLGRCLRLRPPPPRGGSAE